MPRAKRVCSTPRCPEVTTGGRCPAHRAQAEQARGTAAQRGYGNRHREAFRAAVLTRQSLCVCTDQAHGHGPRCLRPSTVADHHPLSVRELITMGLDPTHPDHGRGLCKNCHDKHTAHTQPGGWNAR